MNKYVTRGGIPKKFEEKYLRNVHRKMCEKAGEGRWLEWKPKTKNEYDMLYQLEALKLITLHDSYKETRFSKLIFLKETVND